MTVCYWGTYDRDYPRNRILMEGLRMSGVAVRECHAPIWGGPSEKLRHARRGWLRPFLLLKWAWAYAVLGVRFLTMPPPDFLFVGYTGHFDVFPAWCLSRVRRVPLIFDAFLSLYDSLVLDRGVVGRRGIKAWLLRRIDRWSCRLADRVLLDTRAHQQFFSREFGIPEKKFWILPIGADDRIFKATPLRTPNGHGYTVLHFGRYIPLHGLETVVRAAALLEKSGEACRFKLVGDGAERRRIETLAEQLGVRAVEFLDSQSPEELAGTLREADVCLGIFGETDKAGRVIPNKVYEAMASGRPVITGDSPAAREFLRDGEDCMLCGRGNPEALASAIRTIRRNPALARKLAEGGRRSFEEKASPRVIGGRLKEHLASKEGQHGLVA
jgi:glycosyltransferase involved in cell wall biosynthesis